MTARSRFRSLACALALAALPAAPAFALSYRMLGDDSLLAQAQGVALFEVVHVAPAVDGDEETRYLVAWRQGYAGAPTFGYEWLVLPGAESDRHAHIVDGVPRLAVGEQWLLFHARRADGALQPVQLTLGMFRRFADPTGDLYARTVDVDDEGLQKSAADGWIGLRDAAGFEAWLRHRAAGAKDAADYLIGADDPRRLAKYTYMMFGFPTPMPGRWFEFDAGGSVPVRAGAGGQAGTVYDEFQSLQRAIAAWNDDPGSRVRLAWAGTGSSSAESAINVRWNDPNNEIAGSFDCNSGGVLGIGGSSATSAKTITLGGLKWAQRVRGFVVVQDGAGCVMDRHAGASGAELLTHELGHVLALGHSCGDASSGSCSTTVKNDAIMRASLHGDGRGARLGSDDRAGIAVPYPETAAATRPALIVRNGFENR